MTGNEADYGRLLPIRDDLFPTFAEDQERAAAIIAQSLVAHLGDSGITTIVDLGCGTGEILDAVRRKFIAAGAVDVCCIGIDCAAKEIEVASAKYADCQFVHAVAEEALGAEGPVAAGSLRIEWDRAVLLCVGHTLPHFQNVTRFLDDIVRLRPACLVVDLHEQWDEVVGHLCGADAPPVQQVKQGQITADGTRTEFALTTKRDPRSEDRVLRGIELVTSTGLASIGFWTSQYRRDSQWFRSAIEQRGYSARMPVSYRAGYGPMRGWLFASP